jgi:hypothetical protein
MNALSLRKNRAQTQTPALQNKLKQTGLQKCDAFSLLTHVHTHAMLFFPFYSTMQLASLLASETVECNDCRLQGGANKKPAAHGIALVLPAHFPTPRGARKMPAGSARR